MAITTISAGDATRLTRKRRFSCLLCNCVFDAEGSDYEVVTDLQLREQYGIEASCACPTCSKTAYSYAGRAGMIPEIKSIRIGTLPKTAYRPGQTFDPTGMVVVAVYDDYHEETLAADSYETSPTTALTLSDDRITVTHTASGKTVNIPLFIHNETIIRPELEQAAYVYSGSAQAVKVKGYDAAMMTRSGDTSKTSVGSYAVKFTPKTGYCWPDGTTAAISLPWLIVRADPAAPTLTPAAVTLDATHTSVTFAVTRSGDGVIEVDSSDESVAVATVSGTTVTVKAPTTPKTGEAKITVKVKEGTNYLAFTGGVVCDVTANFDAAEG